MTEAQFQSKFTAWLKERGKESAAYELKVAKGRSLALSKIEEHQIVALDRANRGILAYKIPDLGPGYKPFDAFSLHQTAAYVVILYQRGGENTRDFYRVPISIVLNAIESNLISLKESFISSLVKADSLL